MLARLTIVVILGSLQCGCFVPGPGTSVSSFPVEQMAIEDATKESLLKAHEILLDTGCTELDTFASYSTRPGDSKHYVCTEHVSVDLHTAPNGCVSLTSSIREGSKSHEAARSIFQKVGSAFPDPRPEDIGRICS